MKPEEEAEIESAVARIDEQFRTAKIKHAEELEEQARSAEGITKWMLEDQALLLRASAESL